MTTRYNTGFENIYANLSTKRSITAWYINTESKQSYLRERTSHIVIKEQRLCLLLACNISGMIHFQNVLSESVVHQQKSGSTRLYSILYPPSLRLISVTFQRISVSTIDISRIGGDMVVGVQKLCISLAPNPPLTKTTQAATTVKYPNKHCSLFYAQIDFSSNSILRK